MKIIDLKEKPENIDTLARWHHEEWAYLNPNGSIEQRKEKMQNYLDNTLIPSTYVGEKGGKLVGSAAIVAQDMDTHPELSPWLASVFVDPVQRNQGFGAMLVNHITEKAKADNIKTLYLFTPDKESFYTKLGWSALAKEKYRGYSVTIMAIKLCS
jgi:N-acetylglutamate synthase-like GNAT family acetyltransferase